MLRIVLLGWQKPKKMYDSPNKPDDTIWVIYSVYESSHQKTAPLSNQPEYSQYHCRSVLSERGQCLELVINIIREKWLGVFCFVFLQVALIMMMHTDNHLCPLKNR